MRIWSGLLVLTAVQPAAAALAADAPYYGPMKPWHGIGYKFGFKDEVGADGIWKVTAATRRGEAVDMAMYRAAERARDDGYAYVELLGASASGSPGYQSATVYARPSRSPAAPTACRSKRRGECYTADVGELLRVLGGTDGLQPGVPIVDHRDQYGRAVSYSGFGIAAASNAEPQRLSPARSAPVAAPTSPVSHAAPAVRATTYRGAPTAGDRFEQALKEVQPVKGRSKTGDWTISD